MCVCAPRLSLRMIASRMIVSPQSSIKPNSSTKVSAWLKTRPLSPTATLSLALAVAAQGVERFVETGVAAIETDQLIHHDRELEP